MSELEPHLSLFKANWIAEPERLKDKLQQARVSDFFTGEIAAWCAEIHEHLHELAAELDIDLMLMGGNGASLRFESVQERGSRDNDYLTAASRDDIQRVMDAFAARFAGVPDLLEPTVYVPKGPVPELNMVAYTIDVPLRLSHGIAGSNNNVKVEFHFEVELPPSELLTRSLGAARSELTAHLPQLPYQTVFKLMTLVADPIGIDESTRAAAIPRQLYDLDGLLASFTTGPQWEEMVDYAERRFAREAEYWDVTVVPGEPWDGIRARLDKWTDCVDENSEHWKTTRSVQQSQLRREVHTSGWGWRARLNRVALAAECLRRGPSGWQSWIQAAEVAALVPDTRSKGFKNALAELTGMDVSDLPLERHHLVWDTLVPTKDENLDARLRRARELLTSPESADPRRTRSN